MRSAEQSWRRDAWVSNRVVFESISPLLELSQKARNRGNTSSLTHRFYVETSPGRRGADERTYRREHEVALRRPCLAPYSVLAAWTSTCGGQQRWTWSTGQTKALTLAQQARADSGDDRCHWCCPLDRL